ncbi:hypothetical protein F4818DRAFT_422778 [Hypoxylon cercidicola]|nr:hypothetical protein F4818DRAFT_422778 [Hypoxylon cercidicola]
MSTPFICHRCTARLAQLQTKQLKPGFQLHIQAAAAFTSGSQPRVPEEQKQRLAVKDDFLLGHGTEPSRSSEGLSAQQLQYETLIKTRPRWDGHLKKYLPRRRPLLADGMSVQWPRDLKAKILACLGNYKIVYDDLMHFYSLTREEARHTITQLERLLWGRHSLQEAATRLDLYHDWKSNFMDLLHKKKDWQTNSLGIRPNFNKIIMMDTWHRLGRQRRESLWPQTILSILGTNPDTLPSFIQSTFHSSWCPSYILEDSVYLLFRDFNGEKINYARRDQLVGLVLFLLTNSPPRYISLEQTTIQKLMSWLSTPRVFELYEALKAVEHPLHWNTLLHFASRFAQKSMYKVEAAEVLHSLRFKRGFDINSPAAASVCTTLLNLKSEETMPSDKAAPDELFKMLLDLNFRPNLLGLSALMRNFCVRGRVEVAWNIFNLLIQRGIQPDKQVYSILLNGAKNALDIESLQRIVGMINTSKSWSPYLLHDLLDFIYQSNEFHNKSEKISRRKRKSNSARAWRLMVQTYVKYFHIAPLQSLTRFPLENLLAPGPEKEPPAHLSQVHRLAATLAPLPDHLLMWPNSNTLILMFKAHLRSINNPIPLKDYYTKVLQKKDDRTIRNLVKKSEGTLRDIFLRDFLQFDSTVQNGLQIVQEATKPSVYTYAVLMSGLRNRSHPEGVIATLNTAIDEGITPNMPMWNIVIATLLQEYYIREAVKVVQNLEQLGLKANDRTIREIARLSYSKRRYLARLMEKSGEKRFGLGEQSLARSLLRIWKSNDSEISMKRTRKINRQHGEVDESGGEPSHEEAFSERATGQATSAYRRFTYLQE